MRRGRQRAAAVLLAVSAVLGLPSCAVTAGGCPGWTSFATPSDAAQDAAAVVIGAVRERVGTTEVFGATASVWSVQVDRWEKGDGEERIRVISPPSQCGPEGDPHLGGGDPFSAASEAGPSVIFLVEDAGWRALTPLQGIVPADDGGIPAEWPPGSPGSPPPATVSPSGRAG